MDTKNNIRSIRFSDELAELIERQQGENFTHKFENLVYRCAWELPAKERELKQLEERILISRIRFDKNSGVRMIKKQHYMTRDERQQLEALLKAKIPVSQIARQLGFCRQTIYNEIKRGQYVHTCPWWDELRYSYITKRVFYRLTDRDLWNKGQKKKSGKHAERRVVHPALPSIAARPEAVSQRTERGHWEMDLIVGREGSRPVLLTMVERKTREPLAFKLPDKRAASVRKVFDHLERSTPDFKERFRSITTDNGSEFLEYEKLVQSIHGGKRFAVYYCHSYSAWEKGGVENLNRMFRRWFPKGTDFSRVPKREVADFLDWASHYPRRVLDWKCPAELAASHRFPEDLDAAAGNLCDITTPAIPSAAAPSCCSC